jgi:hypothetical protein
MFGIDPMSGRNPPVLAPPQSMQLQAQQQQQQMLQLQPQSSSHAQDPYRVSADEQQTLERFMVSRAD